MQVFDLDSKIIVCIYRVYLLEIDHLTIYHIIMWDKENRNDTILPPLGIKWEHKQKNRDSGSRRGKSFNFPVRNVRQQNRQKNSQEERWQQRGEKQ